MKNNRVYFLVLFIFCLYFPFQAEAEYADDSFIQNIIYQTMYGESEDLDAIERKIDSMSNDVLLDLKGKLQSIFKQDPPIITSLGQTWMIYGYIYRIDDSLGILEVTKVVEGVFDWDRATTMLGATYLDFITDSGEKFEIFTTVATVDIYDAYLKSGERRIRLYIKEEILSSGQERNQVMKIEPLYEP